MSAVRKESAAADNKLLRAAVALAEKAKPVFPCSPSSKRPITTNGFKDATTNIQQIGDWWPKNPDALIGMPTGAITGVSVVDVDLGKVSHSNPSFHEEGLAATEWWKENEEKYAKAQIIKTRSGGLHIYCKYREGDRNTQGGICKGVDRRGDGGYVIVPPSLGYEVERSMPEAGWPDVAPNAMAGSA